MERQGWKQKSKILCFLCTCQWYLSTRQGKRHMLCATRLNKEYEASMERQEQKRIQDAKDREAKSRRKYEVLLLLSCKTSWPPASTGAELS